MDHLFLYLKTANLNKESDSIFGLLNHNKYSELNLGAEGTENQDF